MLIVPGSGPTDRDGNNPRGLRAAPYRLLAEAMKKTGRAALARYVARGKDQFVLLRPFEEGLIMQQLRYADEVRAFSEVPVAPSEVKEPELRLAMQLIEQIAADSVTGTGEFDNLCLCHGRCNSEPADFTAEVKERIRRRNEADLLSRSRTRKRSAQAG